MGAGDRNVPGPCGLVRRSAHGKCTGRLARVERPQLSCRGGEIRKEPL
jgi:hypothetical protein